jgi:hypothetical protein
MKHVPISNVCHGAGMLQSTHHAPRKARGVVWLLLVPLLLSSCSLFRSHAENQCRKAQGLYNKAVRICPESARILTDTSSVVLHGDSASGAALPQNERADSLAAACAQYAEALAAERELQEIMTGAASRMAFHTERTIDSLRAVIARRPHALTHIRTEACRFDPVYDSTELHVLHIWYDTKLHWTLVDADRTATVITTTPQVVTGPVVVEQHTPWWMWLCMALLALACAYLYMQMDHFRYHFNRSKE